MRGTGPSGAKRQREVAERLKASGALDQILEQIDSGELPLTGEGGLLKEMLKAALERGLQAELTDHLGYEQAATRRAGGRELAERVDGRNGWAPRSATSTWLPRGTATAPSSRNWSEGPAAP